MSSIVPRERHPLIFGAFDRLQPGDGLLLINDHDPKPLFYQFQAEAEGEFTWDYLENGPDVWQVRIGKLATNAAALPGLARIGVMGSVRRATSTFRSVVRPPLAGAALADPAAGDDVTSRRFAGLARLAGRCRLSPLRQPAGTGADDLRLFGTVISLERAVALGRPWPFAPAAAGAGGIAALVGSPAAAAVLAVIAATVMMFSSVQVLRRLVAPFTVVLAIGAGLLADRQPRLAARRRPLRPPFPGGSPFLVLTIAGERLELSRLLAYAAARAENAFTPSSR